MATGTLTNTIKDATGTAVAGVAVTARLRPGPAFRADLTEIAGQATTTTDGSGAWSLALEVNSTTTPAGSWWEIEEDLADSQGGRRVWAALVTAGSHTLQASLVPTPQPVSVLQPLTTLQGDARYQQIGVATYNVRSFGAVGDDSTDDYAAIQAALTAANAAGGGVVELPAGKFTSSAQLLIGSNTTLRGAGRFATAIRQTFALAGQGGNQLLRNLSTTAGNVGIGVTDLTLQTPAPVGASPNLTAYGEAINFYGCSDTLITRCRFLYGAVSLNPLPSVAGTSTVHSTGLNNRHQVTHNLFDTCAEALALVQGTDLTFSANVLRNMYDSSMSVNSSGERISITNNIIDKTGNTYAALAHIELTNDAAGDANGIRDITINGNTLLNAANSGTRAIAIAGPASYVAIGANPIRNCAGGGIYTSGVSHLTVSGNPVATTGGSTSGINIVTDRAATDVTVTGNSATGCGGNGITVGGGGSSLAEVTVVGNTATANTGFGLSVNTAVTSGLIANNNVAGNTGGSISTSSSSGYTIRGNAGYNPVGLSTLSVGASPATVTNTFQVAGMFYFSGGTVSALAKNSITLCTSVPAANAPPFGVWLEPGESVVITHTGAPSAWKDLK